MEGVTFARTYGRVFLLEQDDALAGLLEAVMETRGYNVVRFSDGAQAVGTAERERPSLVILDLNAPWLHGFQLCRRLRESSNVPILVLGPTASVAEASTALDLGADDYVPRPFSLDELLARIKALMRRSLAQPLPEEQGVLRFGDLSINLSSRQVARQGQVIMTTPIEFDLLKLLASNSSRVVTHKELLTRIWGEEYVDGEDYLRVHISNIRRKIEPDPGNPRYIKTIRGIGYRIFAPSEE